MSDPRICRLCYWMEYPSNRLVDEPPTETALVCVENPEAAKFVEPEDLGCKKFLSDKRAQKSLRSHL